ncbi:glutaredoxin 3 [Thalassotalea insulae]|uniref:Glutaredoxin n=2 Tax=Thalassotalea insulae TaxID=2056778 RepID=A0ABQ6GQD0_9GAMM|nr:glutaredoxin 3 [Thalassotalea insulae]
MAVEIYSKVTCGFCMRAKMLLKQKNVAFTEIDISHDTELRDKMIKRSNGAFTVPQIFIDNQHIGGCDDLYALHYQNKLDQLLMASA